LPRKTPITTAKAPEYVCARHEQVRSDAGLTGFFLCEDCAGLLRAKVFNNIESSYEALDIKDGYCMHCGKKKTVRQRFWYLCEICERIVRSYSIEKAASEFMTSWWARARLIEGIVRRIRLDVTDAVKLMSFEAHKTWKAERTQVNPDFIGVDEDTGKNLFAIEMKTGRRSINKMSAFQLDVSDCDDIISFVRRLQIPSYLFHVWVVDEFTPPTTRKIALDAWWLSIFDMKKCFQQIRTRARERRPAAYYRRTCFTTLDKFVNQLNTGGIENDAKMLTKRMPILYVLE